MKSVEPLSIVYTLGGNSIWKVYLTSSFSHCKKMEQIFLKGSFSKQENDGCKESEDAFYS